MGGEGWDSGGKLWIDKQPESRLVAFYLFLYDFGATQIGFYHLALVVCRFLCLLMGIPF